MGIIFNIIEGTFDFTGPAIPAPENSFTTIQVPSGSSPVATSPTDTLTLANGLGINIIGDSTTDTVTIHAVDLVSYTQFGGF